MKIIMKYCFSCIYDLIDYLFVVQRHISNIQAPFCMYVLREQAYHENEYTSKQSFKSRCVHWVWAYWWKFSLPQDKDDRYDICYYWIEQFRIRTDHLHARGTYFRRHVLRTSSVFNWLRTTYHKSYLP
jgi:hypothetical protein